MAAELNKPAKVTLTVDPSKVDPGLRKARSKFDKFGGELKKGFSGVKGIAGSMIGAAFGIRAIDKAFEVGRGVLQFEDRMSRLRIQANRSASEMDNFRSKINLVSRDTGVDRDEILGGAEAYVTLTGDMDGAEKAVSTFGKVAQASGAGMGDIASTAAALKQNLNVDPKNFEQAFSILLAQGKAGAIELRELSTLLSGVAPTFARFGVTGTEGMAQLGGMLQLTRQGFGSAAEAVTGLEGMMTAFQRNSKKFERAGVKIFQRDPKTGQKRMRELADIVQDLGAKGFGPDKLIDMFGRVEGLKAFQELTKVPGALDQIIAKTLQADDVNVDFAERMKDPAARMEVAMARMKTAIAEAFTPERIEAFASAMAKVAGLVEKVAGGLSAVEDVLSLGRSEEDVAAMQADRDAGMDAGTVLARDRARAAVREIEAGQVIRANWERGVQQTGAAIAGEANQGAVEAASSVDVNVGITIDEQGFVKAVRKGKQDEFRVVR